MSGGAPEYYDFIGERELRPVMHVEPDYESVVRVLEEAVANPFDLSRRGREGRDFVVKHNNYVTVARRFADFWQRRIEIKNKANRKF